MKKAKRIFSVLVLMTAIALWAGSFPSLFAQTAKESQAAQEASTAAAQTQAVQQKAAQERRAAESQEFTMRVKTYELKYISASEFMRSARFYVEDSTGTESSLTVRIFERNIPEFEALLKKLDVEKRNIQFQVYTIIASKDQPLEHFKNNFVSETQGIADKDLKRVLDEMKGLWNFKYYWVDSPSFLVVKDGAAGSMFKLVSPYDFDMNILRVQLRGDEPGKRIISVGQIKLIQTFNLQVKSALIDTSDVTFKEKGYLVVGVTGMIGSGQALILVISAEIK
jgi:hypothetical protein